MRASPLNIALVNVHSCCGSEAPGNDTALGSVMQLAKALAAAGHTVDVMCRREDESAPEIESPFPGLRVLTLTAGPVRCLPEHALLRHVPAYAAEIEQVMRNGRPYDVVHANRLLAGLVAQRLKESFGVPFAMTFHTLAMASRQHRHVETDAFEQSRVEIERRIIRHADRLIAECPEQEDLLVRAYGVRREQIALAPVGVDTDFFALADRTSARQALGLAETEFVMLHVGRLQAREGVDNAIRALSRLDAKINARLLIAGGDAGSDIGQSQSCVEILRALALERNVSDRIQLLGVRPLHELPALYSAADVLVATPWFEPFDSAALQAMACGTPVIASNVGAGSYTVEDGSSGFLVRSRDPVDLALRLAQMHANPVLARALGRGGQRRARALFNWNRVARQLEFAYRRMCDEAASSSRPMLFGALPWFAPMHSADAANDGLAQAGAYRMPAPCDAAPIGRGVAHVSGHGAGQPAAQVAAAASVQSVGLGGAVLPATFA